jgi:hypothetical protein
VSKDAKFKELLTNCQVCESGLVEAIGERVEGGESVLAVCNDYEDFQRQTHGEVFITAQGLRTKYRRTMGIGGESKALTKEEQQVLDAIRAIFQGYNSKDPAIRQNWIDQGKDLAEGVPSRMIKVELEEMARLHTKRIRMVAAAMGVFGVGDWKTFYSSLKQLMLMIEQEEKSSEPKDSK